MGMRQTILIRELKESLARLEGRSDIGGGERMRLREGAPTEEQRKQAKAIRKEQKRAFQESVDIYKRLGLSDVGAEAAARGRFRG